MEPNNSSYELKLYPIEDRFIAFLDLTKTINLTNSITSNVETAIILDRSGSMGESVPYIVNRVLPKFFELLSYDSDAFIHLIAFECSTTVHKLKVKDFRNFNMVCDGGTNMAPAVTELHRLFKTFTANSLRILTISDGEVFDQLETSRCGAALAECAGKCNILVNSQAVRFFTSYAQPDTTALCSLLQLNNVDKSQMIDIQANKNHELIAEEMANLFLNDGLQQQSFLNSNQPIFYKFPWDSKPTNQLLVLTGKQNIFWIDKISLESQEITFDGKHLKVSIQKDMNFDQLLLSSQLNLVIDRMKILKIVNTDTAKQTIQSMIEYFTKIENVLVKLAANEVTDSKSISDRARLVKLKMVMSKKLTTYLQTIANDDEVNKLNAEQKANYLRNLQVSSKAGRGLAKRVSKKKSKNWAARLDFDGIVHREVQAIKANFHEIKDIDYNSHKVSFYSQATTLEGIRTLVELSDDLTFSRLSADDILQVLNIVGVACNCPIGDFPDASTWRVNEIYYGCYVSVADIITSIHQSGDSGFVLKAPGIDKEITNVIPVFDDPRIGVFLKKYAPSILEFTSSIGMRRVIADVSMTFGYNIIAGIRRMMYDLNKNKSSIHLETFKNLISTASTFVGKYHNQIEELLTDKNCGKNSYYLANNGTASLIVPLIRIYSKKDHEAIKRMPDILRSIYSYEIWKGISKEFKGKQKFNQIVKEMLYKLLGIDLDANKVKLALLFESELERENIKFPDEFKINHEYLDKLTQPLYYHNYISLLPQLLKAATANQLEDIKKIPEMTKTTALEAFGISYSYKKFIFLNVFQALRYPRGTFRADRKNNCMNILDVKNHSEVTQDVKKYVREQFEAQYDFEVKNKRRQEELEMAQTIVESLINSTNYQVMIDTWRNGITRNNVTYKIANSSSNGFKQLCRNLVDLKIEIPLRAKIIAVLLLGRDADGQIVYNNGELADIKNIQKYKKRFLLTERLNVWNKIQKKFNNRELHEYRDKRNRRGHGKSKPSYWALGFDNLPDLLKTYMKHERKIYFEQHKKCCSSKIVCQTLYPDEWIEKPRPQKFQRRMRRPRFYRHYHQYYPYERPDDEYEIKMRAKESVKLYKKLNKNLRQKRKISNSMLRRRKTAKVCNKSGKVKNYVGVCEDSADEIEVKLNKMQLKKTKKFDRNERIMRFMQKFKKQCD